MAANSILKLKVESEEYDAKLKKAAEGIRHLAEVAHKGGGELTGLEKAELDYVKALGSMETKSRTAAGGVRELESTFKELTVVYNQLNDVEKQDEGGKALRASLDQIKQRAQAARAELEEVSKSLQGTGDSMKGGGGGIFSGLGSKMEGALAVFGGNLMTKAAGAVANLGAEMADMVKQGVEMAKAGEGVRIAFERLGNGQILDGLREATHGTVTDLELMKAAVKFNDFKLPVEELGTMLAFAQQKAKDTGQSVDYMVDSIVTGLGRKSLMILDNLGLSATEIRERMKETGDMTKAVGSIIRDQMKNAGDYVETAADRAAQANVSLQNKMEELGRKFAPVEEASNQLWTSMKIGILDIIGGPLATLLNSLTEAGRLKNALNGLNGEEGSGNTKVGQQLKKLQAIKKAGGSDYIFNSTLSGMKEDYNREIAWREQYAKDIQAWQSGKRSDVLSARIKEGQKRSGSDFLDAERVTTEANAYKVMLSQLVSGAKDITNPRTAPTTPVKLPTTPTKTIKEDIQYADDSIMAQEKLVQELTQKWKTASGELRDGYLKDLEDAQKKLAEMTGKVKGPDLDKLFPDMSKQNYNTGYAGSAQAKYDSARVDLAVGPMNLDAVNTYIGSIKGMLKDANLGDELYNRMTEKMKDATTVSTLLQEMMERGLAGADLETTAQALKEKLLSPEGIDQTTIQSFLDTLNAQIEEAGGVGLKLNADTGEVTDDKDKGDGEDLKKFNEGIGKLTGGLSQVTGGLKAVGIEIPKEVDQVIGVINGVSQIISGVGTIISIFGTTAITANTTAIGLNTAAVTALIAAIEVNTATNFIPFANGGIVPAFAHGGLIGRAAGGLMIPGNSMSGDRLRLPVDGGLGMIGVNSGELILNRAQQGNLASQLEGGVAAGTNTQPFINGEQIYLGLQAYMRRSGLGEIVTAER